jgi:cyclophilin family peptidyl-prolyl cis-trans isomerase
MPRSRRFRKNTDKPEWGKNNPQTKAKNKQYTLIFGVIIAAVVLVSALLVVGGVFNAAPAPSPTATPTATPSESTSPTVAPSGSPTATPAVTPQLVATPATSPAGEYSANGTRILIQTSMGNITIQLRDDKPITTANFINQTQHGIYDNTIFHRVQSGFMIQGGVVQQSGSPVPNAASIVDEIGNDNHNVYGTIAMAKTNQPNSASISFFINVADNSLQPSFDSTYTVFGKVIGGMDVANAISNVQRTSNPYTGETNTYPVQTITLISATILS